MPHIWQLYWFVICLFQVNDKNNETTRSYDLLNDRYCSKNITASKIFYYDKVSSFKKGIEKYGKKSKARDQVKA